MLEGKLVSTAQRLQSNGAAPWMWGTPWLLQAQQRGCKRIFGFLQNKSTHYKAKRTKHGRAFRRYLRGWGELTTTKGLH